MHLQFVVDVATLASSKLPGPSPGTLQLNLDGARVTFLQRPEGMASPPCIHVPKLAAPFTH